MYFSHQKLPLVTKNEILATLTKNFCQRSKKFLLGFRNQTNDYIFFPKKWSCSKKTVWIPRIPFWRRSWKFFHQKSQVNVFNSGNIFWKDAQKTQAFSWTLWMRFWQSWQKVSVKKRFLFNIRNYWNNHFFSQKYLNFTVKIFWTRILPFWQAWIDFLAKNPKKVWFVFRKQTMEYFVFPTKFFLPRKSWLHTQNPALKNVPNFFVKSPNFCSSKIQEYFLKQTFCRKNPFPPSVRLAIM